MREVREALKGLGLRIHALSDFSNAPEIERMARLCENALKKPGIIQNIWKGDAGGRLRIRSG